MSMPPADPPPPAPFDWTSSREVALGCEGCGALFLLSYKYRFVEGLASTTVRCPAPGCRRPREYYLPVNAFEVRIGAAPGGASRTS